MPPSSTHLPAPPAPTDWLHLVTRWQTLASEWSLFWNRALATWTNDAPPAAPAGDWHDLVDHHEIHLRALWRAVAPDAGELPHYDPAADRDDKRFAAPEWRTDPFFALAREAYFLNAHFCRAWVAQAKLDPVTKRKVAFAIRQYLDAMAPTNFAASNPEAIRLALETRGESFRRGMENLMGDLQRGRITMTDPTAFRLGVNLAITPGAVVFRNDLIELIQYSPVTPTVHARPLVIIPPCINKYYILDLQPENSFVRYATEQGHTVFIVSWRNVGPELGTLGWDDYLRQGVVAALDVAAEVSGAESLNTLGFCVGGTLLASVLAILAARGDRRVASATFLTTMLDFEEPGEIGVFVSEELLVAREPELMAGGRIHGGELATAFASLRANDLVWNYVVDNYLKGRTPPAFDLLQWNSDSSNLAGPMYVYYLRNTYLRNLLRVPNALTMLGEKVDLGRVRVPLYVLAAREDHIVPWKSAFASARLLGGELTFVLGASGHIAGAINPASKNRRSYWVGGEAHAAADADAWLAGAAEQPGSWWRHWAQWMAAQGGGSRPAPKQPGSRRHPPLCAAPGTYVLEQSAPPGAKAGPTPAAKPAEQPTAKAAPTPAAQAETAPTADVEAAPGVRPRRARRPASARAGVPLE
jgi:polyhydroxyalkanoate synthase